MMREATERLMQLFPNLDIMSVHGQMDGETIDAAMEKFSSGLADVLVATTIVESGLDIPNCNTIIIENVQFFGLSSLYQLRGRVGRADRQAFAYMFYSSEESELTPKRTGAISSSRRVLRSRRRFQIVRARHVHSRRWYDVRR